MNEKDFFEIVEALCKRPKMYTPTGSFFEGVSFLEGYGVGANVGETTYHSAFTPFNKWLIKKFGIKKVMIGWDEFREMFSSDTEALENLSLLYKEYVDNL
jgi:hypothetical protein